MSRFRKNQAVIVALVLMVVVAGYLNFTSKTAQTGGKTQTGETSAFLADGFEEGTLLPTGETSAAEQGAQAEGQGDTAMPVTGENEESAEAEGTGEELPGTAVLVDSDAVIPEYFAEAKVERENARAKSQDILYDLMANADTPDSE